MAKPADNNNDLNQKKGLELNSSTMTLLGNVIVIIFVVIANIVTYILLSSSLDKKLEKLLPEQEAVEEEESDAPQQGILLDLGDFILNLADTGKRSYLKVGVAIELSKTEEEIQAALAPAAKSGGHGHEAAAPADPNADIVAEMDRFKPAIRDAVISVLSNKTSDELSSPTGKEIAKEEILEMVNTIFDGQREVMRVSFGQFIIQ